jgi:SAM-dependent MidA family methyltransferase
VSWVDTVDRIGGTRPLFLIANEFFDALPVRQFQRVGDIWRERVVGLRDGALVFGLSGPVALPGTDRQDVADGGIVEICPAAAPIMGWIGARIAAAGGAGLIVDYGGARSLGDTVQAVRGHAYTDPLAAPGLADLTAHVDFGALAAAAGPALASAPTPQGVFLERLGITARARALARGLDEADLEAHVAAHRRLTHPEEMGTLFQTLALTAPGAPLPPGVDPSEDP